jgi:DNA repair protein RecN (Recombination protein N)
LPAIAAIADYNYFINKQIENERTITIIKKLEENEIIREIARISSGEVNEITLNYARELRCKKMAS